MKGIARIATAAAALAWPISAMCAEDIAIALTDDLIEVDAGFTGARVTLFGTLIGPGAAAGETAADAGEIVAVIRGPATSFRMRPMVRKRMIWTTGPAIDLAAPGIFLAGGTQPLTELADEETRHALDIAFDRHSLAKLLKPSGPEAAAFLESAGAEQVSAAFLDEARRTKRVAETTGGIEFKKGALFSVRLDLPPTTPVGDYQVEVFLFRDGEAISQDETRLSVRKVGLEREIYELAHNRPIIYGIGCVLISLAAGWIAAAAFRK